MSRAQPSFHQPRPAAYIYVHTLPTCCKFTCPTRPSSCMGWTSLISPSSHILSRRHLGSAQCPDSRISNLTRASHLTPRLLGDLRRMKPCNIERQADRQQAELNRGRGAVGCVDNLGIEAVWFGVCAGSGTAVFIRRVRRGQSTKAPCGQTKVAIKSRGPISVVAVRANISSPPTACVLPVALGHQTVPTPPQPSAPKKEKAP
jgi:hypothetical protein